MQMAPHLFPILLNRCLQLLLELGTAAVKRDAGLLPASVHVIFEIDVTFGTRSPKILTNIHNLLLDTHCG